MEAITFCKYNKFGHCKFQNTCRHKHVNTVCRSENCDVALCEKRHPKLCRYFLNYGRCKFDPCSYSHADATFKSSEIEKVHNVIEDIRKEMFAFKEILLSKTEKINLMEQKLETEMMSVKTLVQTLKETTELHQLKLEVFQEEFHTYSEVVDTLENKICELHRLPYPLVAFPPNSVLALSQDLTSPSLLTPPCTSKKKTRP